jgi:hypothetical protein
MMKNDSSGTHEIKARIAMAKATFNRNNTVFPSKFYYNFR